MPGPQSKGVDLNVLLSDHRNHGIACITGHPMYIIGIHTIHTFGTPVMWLKIHGYSNIPIHPFLTSNMYSYT